MIWSYPKCSPASLYNRIKTVRLSPMLKSQEYRIFVTSYPRSTSADSEYSSPRKSFKIPPVGVS